MNYLYDFITSYLIKNNAVLDGSVILGIIVFFACMLWGAKNLGITLNGLEVYAALVAFAGELIGFAVIFVDSSERSLYGKPGVFRLFMLLILLLAAFGDVIYVMHIRKEAKLDDLYDECNKLGLTTIETEADKERAKLIAAKYHVKVDKLLKMYSVADEKEKEETRKNQNQTLNDKKSEEKKS